MKRCGNKFIIYYSNDVDVEKVYASLRLDQAMMNFIEINNDKMFSLIAYDTDDYIKALDMIKGQYKYYIADFLEKDE